MDELGKGASRPDGDEKPTEVKKLGVLGAGMMGAGIAYVSAVAGIDDSARTRSRKATAGKDHAAELVESRSSGAA